MKRELKSIKTKLHKMSMNWWQRRFWHMCKCCRLEFRSERGWIHRDFLKRRWLTEYVCATCSSTKEEAMGVFAPNLAWDGPLSIICECGNKRKAVRKDKYVL